jgi:hypothetical protein
MDEILKLRDSEGRLDSAGTFTLSNEKALEKLRQHSLPHGFGALQRALQWAVALGCQEVVCSLENQQLVMDASMPIEDPFDAWPEDDLPSFFHATTQLERLRGHLLLELTGSQSQPASVELRQSFSVLRSWSSSEGAEIPKGHSAKGTNLTIAFRTAAPEEEVFQFISSTFSHCPIAIYQKGFFGNHPVCLTNAFPGTPGPILFDAYHNNQLDFPTPSARGIICLPIAPLTPPECTSMIVVRDARLAQTAGELTLARYVSSYQWVGPRQVTLAAGKSSLVLQTGLGCINVYCTGTVEDDRIVPVYYGAKLPEIKGRLGLPGLLVVACADGLETDIGLQGLREGEALDKWFADIREVAERFVHQASAHPPKPELETAFGRYKLGQAYTRFACGVAVLVFLHLFTRGPVASFYSKGLTLELLPLNWKMFEYACYLFIFFVVLGLHSEWQRTRRLVKHWTSLTVKDYLKATARLAKAQTPSSKS